MPVCVAGMHRSGTSLVAAHLRACGLDLGPDAALKPSDRENPAECLEHLALVETNEEILNQLGGAWDCPPPEPADWTAGRLAPLLPRADAIVAGFAGREPWGWHDPRTSLTLPFWRSLLPDLRIVVVVRNPLAVALSLRQRHGFSYALGLTLWEITNRRVMAADGSAGRVVTHHDAYVDDPRPEVRRLLAAMEMPTPPDALADLGAAAAPSHPPLSTCDLRDADVADRVLDLYRSLCDEAKWRDADLGRPRAKRRKSASRAAAAPDVAALAAIETGVGRLNGSAVELRRLRRELDEHRAALTNREARVAEVGAERDRADREREQAVRERELAERDAATLRQTAVDQAAHLAALGVQLRTFADHEAALRASLLSAHEQLLHRDAEIVATLGSALHPHAPGAPAAIYYRQLLQKIRALVDANLPPTAPILVVSGGDDAMIDFGERPARHFPPLAPDAANRYLPTDGATARAQLDLLKEEGAEFLVLPVSGTAWLARYPDLAGYLNEAFPVVARDEAAAVVYALAGSTGAVP